MNLTRLPKTSTCTAVGADRQAHCERLSRDAAELRATLAAVLVAVDEALFAEGLDGVTADDPAQAILEAINAQAEKAERTTADLRVEVRRLTSNLEIEIRDRNKMIEAERVNTRLANEMTIARFIEHQRGFSGATFGPGRRTKGIIEHIRKELVEIEADPADVREWVDVVILALDGAWRAGHEPDAIAEALRAKLEKNKRRAWPRWQDVGEDAAIEHVRLEAFAVLVRPWAVYVKEWDFFVGQGGLKDSWGASWIRIEADSIEDARLKAKGAQVAVK